MTKEETKAKVIHDFSKEVVDTIKRLGVIVNEFDEHGNIIDFLNLPQWFKEVNGHIFEVPFTELPDSAKHVHLKYRDYKEMFSREERDEYAKQESIGFFGWYAEKMLVFIEYLRDIKPRVTSNEIEEKLLEFEGKPFDQLYTLYLQSKTEK